MINLSPETEAIIKAKADLTGRTPDQVVREVLARTGDVLPWRNTSSAPKKVTREALITGMEEIASRCAARPVIDPRSIDEIIGYDDFGLPR